MLVVKLDLDRVSRLTTLARLLPKLHYSIILTLYSRYGKKKAAILNLGFHDIGIIAPRGVHNSS